MFRNAYDFKAFYKTRQGQKVCSVLQERIEKIWPELKGLSVCGMGYALPYLDMMLDQGAERIFSVMPQALGVHHWPEEGKNLVSLSHESALPFAMASVDRVLMVHGLEYTERLHESLNEIWRILKPNGKMLLVVTNRKGYWAKADWSPFGQGTPYSINQLGQDLREHMFVVERIEEALFMPAFKNSMAGRVASSFEKIGPHILPFIAGVHMVEVTKQLYAGADIGGGSKQRVSKGLFGLRPVPVLQGS